MKYIDFLSMVRKNKLYVFNTSELPRYFPSSSPKTIQNQIDTWRKRGLLTILKRGIYKLQLPEGGPDVPDLYIANRIYEPSYISLETALSFYSIIPEVAAEVTSLTTRQTKLFKNKFGVFRYRSCKNNAYCGYRIMIYEGYEVYIAEEEKALVDFVYFKSRYGDEINIYMERFDKELLEKMKWKKIFNYARMYNKKTLAVLENIRGMIR